ncbi:Aldo/keto reductase family-domain-containing protein [Kalaharituber pfeilii]|nr:Aldo/keto reductase family-domain-containing protein [Kalaharituber pfeilii]
MQKFCPSHEPNIFRSTFAVIHSPLTHLGGAAFSTQMQASPFGLPAVILLSKAFDSGISAVDTSPYYGPSEIIIGKALSHPNMVSKYPRHTYFIATKVVGLKRISSIILPGSHAGSTTAPHLDLLYCHDVEFVSTEEMLEALEVLIQLKKEGVVHYIGISGYSPDLLLKRVKIVNEQQQSYNQIKAELVTGGVVVKSSPLAMGLLRLGGPFGNWHPAPKGLHETCAVKLAQWCETEKGKKLANIALKYAAGKMALMELDGGHTIMGPSLPVELEENMGVLESIMIDPTSHHRKGLRPVDRSKVLRLSGLFAEARAFIGPEWLDYSWDSPPTDWQEIKEVNRESMVEQE